MGQIQNAVNVAAGSIATSVSMGQHLAQQQESVAQQQESVAIEKNRALGQYQQDLGSNKRMLADLEYEIKKSELDKAGLESDILVSKLKEQNLLKYPTPMNKLKAAGESWGRFELNDKYAKATESLKGMKYQKTGLQNSIKFIKNEIKRLEGKE